MRAVELPTDGQLWYQNEFLQSAEWKETSRKVIESAGGKCYLCGTSSAVLQAHHIYYNNYDLCDLESLVCLCRDCHKCTHEVLDGFERLPQKSKNVKILSISELGEFCDNAILKFYYKSYIRHEDSKTFLGWDNINKLRPFLALQLSSKYPKIRLFNDYNVMDDYGIPNDLCYAHGYQDKIQHWIAYHVWHIKYAYYCASDEQLRKHFKMGPKAWESIHELIKINKERYKNMKALDLTNVTATQGGEFPRVTPGGYVIGIVSVEDVPEREYLKITYDIAEGELKNYYREMKERTGYDLPVFYKSYKDKALGFFKGFIDAVESSNPGYKWNNDERTLTRKLVGAVLREEEYKNRDGEIKTSLKPDVFYPIDAIRAGKFDVPPKKTLSPAPAAPAYTAPAQAPAAQPADDLPVGDIFGDDGVPF